MTTNLKKILHLLILLFPISIINAQLLSLRYSSSLYLFETRDSSLNEVMNYRGNNNLYFNFATTNYGFKGNFGVFNDQFPKDELRTKISNLTFSTNHFEDKVKLSLGRQFVSYSPSVGNIDGVNLNLKLFENLISFSSFAGQNVIKSEDALFKNKFADNHNFGSSISIFPNDNLFFRLSYSNKNWKRDSYTATRIDSLLEPTIVTVISNPNVEEFLSFDASIEKEKSFRVYLRSDYNQLTKTISRGNLFTKFKISDPLNFSVEYFFHEPRLNYNSIFSVFHSSSLSELETTIDYEFSSTIKTFAKLANVKYEDETSGRFIFGGAIKNFNFSYTKNSGYSGDLNGLSIYTNYPLFENKLKLLFSLGFASYKLSENSPLNNVSTFSLGANSQLVKNLQLDANLQWLKNPHYKNDVRVMLKASYFYSNIFKNDETK